MGWPTPQYSRNQVNKAGQTLINWDWKKDHTREEFKKLLYAYDVVSNWRSCHGYPINTFQATLRTKLKPIDSKAIVAQRLKRLPSIVNKLWRLTNMKLSTMQDIGGLRAVVSSVQKVRALEEHYRKSRFQHRLNKDL